MAKSRKEKTVEIRIQVTPEAREALRTMSPSERKQGEFLSALLLASFERYQALQEAKAADPVDALLVQSVVGKTGRRES